MTANQPSRSPGSIPNNRSENLAPPVPILRRATPHHRRVPSSGKSLGGLSHPLTALIVPTCYPLLAISVPPCLGGDLPRPRNSRALSKTAHSHETPVNRTSCVQIDPPFALSNPRPSPRKSTFPSPASHQPPTPPTLKPLPLPSLPILPPPSDLAHPHETRVNRTSCGQNNPPFARSNLLPPPRQSTFPSPARLLVLLNQKNRGGCPQTGSAPPPAAALPLPPANSRTPARRVVAKKLDFEREGGDSGRRRSTG